MAPPVVPTFTAVDGSGQSLAGKNNGVRPQVSRLRNRRNEGKVTTRGGRDTRNEGELEQKKKQTRQEEEAKKKGVTGCSASPRLTSFRRCSAQTAAAIERHASRMLRRPASQPTHQRANGAFTCPQFRPNYKGRGRKWTTHPATAFPTVDRAALARRPRLRRRFTRTSHTSQLRLS